MTTIKIAFIAVLGTALALAAGLYARYGGGKPYAELSSAPLIDKSQLEKVLEYPENIGNVAVATDGRVFFTVHPKSRPTGAKLLEFNHGKFRPFPSAAA